MAEMRNETDVDMWARALELADLQVANTRKSYKGTIRQFRRFLGGEGPNPYQFKLFFVQLKDRNLKPATLKNRRAALNWFFKEVLGQQPPAIPIEKGPESPSRALSDEDVSALFAACRSEEERDIVFLLSNTGWRPSELLGLKKRDIGSDGRIDVVIKGGKQKRIPVPAEVLRMLKRRARSAADDRIFPFGYQTLRTRLKAVGDRAGIEGLGARVFRSTFATTSLYKGGYSLGQVSRLLAHSKADYTLTYLDDRGRDDLGLDPPQLLFPRP